MHLPMLRPAVCVGLTGTCEPMRLNGPSNVGTQYINGLAWSIIQGFLKAPGPEDELHALEAEPQITRRAWWNQTKRSQ